MSVRFKFKNELDYSSIPCDGFHISVRDLKREIVRKKRFGRVTDFDLDVINHQDNKTYDNEEALIPKNSTLIIVRRPLLSGSQKVWEEDKVFASSVLSTSTSSGFLGSSKEASEDDKINDIVNNASDMYSQKNWVKYRGKAAGMKPSPAYRCAKCQQAGQHWKEDCPLAAKYGLSEIKKTTGIPRSFLKPANKDTPGAKLNPQGLFMVNELEEKAYKNTKVEKPVWETEEASLQSMPTIEIPKELKCPICNDLFRDCIMMPMCAHAFCDECARNALIESENNACPVCEEPDNSPDELIPNRQLRDKVNKFKNSSGLPVNQPTSQQSSPKVEEKPTLPDIVLPVPEGSEKKSAEESSSKFGLAHSPAAHSSAGPSPYTSPIFNDLQQDSEPPAPGDEDSSLFPPMKAHSQEPSRHDSPGTPLDSRSETPNGTPPATDSTAPSRSPKRRRSRSNSPRTEPKSRTVPLPDTSLPPPGFSGIPGMLPASLPTHTYPSTSLPQQVSGYRGTSTSFSHHYSGRGDGYRGRGRGRHFQPHNYGSLYNEPDIVDTFERIMAQKDRLRGRSPPHSHRYASPPLHPARSPPRSYRSPSSRYRSRSPPGRRSQRPYDHYSRSPRGPKTPPPMDIKPPRSMSPIPRHGGSLSPKGSGRAPMSPYRNSKRSSLSPLSHPPHRKRKEHSPRPEADSRHHSKSYRQSSERRYHRDEDGIRTRENRGHRREAPLHQEHNRTPSLSPEPDLANKQSTGEKDDPSRKSRSRKDRSRSKEVDKTGRKSRGENETHKPPESVASSHRKGERDRGDSYRDSNRKSKTSQDHQSRLKSQNSQQEATSGERRRGRDEQSKSSGKEDRSEGEKQKQTELSKSEKPEQLADKTTSAKIEEENSFNKKDTREEARKNSEATEKVSNNEKSESETKKDHEKKIESEKNASTVSKIEQSNEDLRELLKKKKVLSEMEGKKKTKEQEEIAKDDSPSSEDSESAEDGEIVKKNKKKKKVKKKGSSDEEVESDEEKTKKKKKKSKKLKKLKKEMKTLKLLIAKQKLKPSDSEIDLDDIFSEYSGERKRKKASSPQPPPPRKVAHKTSDDERERLRGSQENRKRRRSGGESEAGSSGRRAVKDSGSNLQITLSSSKKSRSRSRHRGRSRSSSVDKNVRNKIVKKSDSKSSALETAAAAKPSIKDRLGPKPATAGDNSKRGGGRKDKNSRNRRRGSSGSRKPDERKAPPASSKPRSEIRLSSKSTKERKEDRKDSRREGVKRLGSKYEDPKEFEPDYEMD